jgi:hypothetical protein
MLMYGTRIIRFKFIFYVYLNYDFCSMLPFLVRVILRTIKKTYANCKCLEKNFEWVFYCFTGQSDWVFIFVFKIF